MPTSTTENRKPITEYSDKLTDLVTEANETKKPVILTEDDHPQAVVIDWESYKKFQNTVRLAFMLGEAEADRKAGRGVSLEECISELERDGAISN